MTEFDLVSDPEIRRWKEHCHALPVGDGDLFFDHEQFSAFSLDLSADLSEKIDEGAGATRHDRYLRGIHLDDRIVHSHTSEGGHQMFHGRNGDSVKTQSGCQRRISHVADICLDPIVAAQIPADKNDPLVGSSRPDHHTALSSRIQPYAPARDFLL